MSSSTKALELITTTLKSAGIHISIDSCGCCNGVWMRGEIKGKKIDIKGVKLWTGEDKPPKGKVKKRGTHNR